MPRTDALEISDGVIPVRRKKTGHQSALRSLAEIEKEHILSVLDHTLGVIAGPNGAAMILEMSPNTFRSRMEKLGIS